MRRLFWYVMVSILLYGADLSAQNLRFNGTEDKMLVTSGCRVTIGADSAFLVSKSRSADLNRRLDELDSLRAVCFSLSARNEELCRGISQTQELLSKLKKNMDSDSDFQNRSLDSVLAELDATIAALRSNNFSLREQNDELSAQVDDLKAVVKKLKKETRYVWWNGCVDKVAAFAGGVAVGVLFCLLF